MARVGGVTTISTTTSSTSSGSSSSSTTTMSGKDDFIITLAKLLLVGTLVICPTYLLLTRAKIRRDGDDDEDDEVADEEEGALKTGEEEEGTTSEEEEQKEKMLRFLFSHLPSDTYELLELQFHLQKTRIHDLTSQVQMVSNSDYIKNQNYAGMCFIDNTGIVPASRVRDCIENDEMKFGIAIPTGLTGVQVPQFVQFVLRHPQVQTIVTHLFASPKVVPPPSVASTKHEASASTIAAYTGAANKQETTKRKMPRRRAAAPKAVLPPPSSPFYCSPCTIISETTRRQVVFNNMTPPVSAIGGVPAAVNDDGAAIAKPTTTQHIIPKQPSLSSVVPSGSSRLVDQEDQRHEMEGEEKKECMDETVVIVPKVEVGMTTTKKESKIIIKLPILLNNLVTETFELVEIDFDASSPRDSLQNLLPSKVSTLAVTEESLKLQLYGGMCFVNASGLIPHREVQDCLMKGDVKLAIAIPLGLSGGHVAQFTSVILQHSYVQQVVKHLFVQKVEENVVTTKEQEIICSNHKLDDAATCVTEYSPSSAATTQEEEEGGQRGGDDDDDAEVLTADGTTTTSVVSPVPRSSPDDASTKIASSEASTKIASSEASMEQGKDGGEVVVGVGGGGSENDDSEIVQEEDFLPNNKSSYEHHFLPNKSSYEHELASATIDVVPPKKEEEEVDGKRVDGKEGARANSVPMTEEKDHQLCPSSTSTTDNDSDNTTGGSSSRGPTIMSSPNKQKKKGVLLGSPKNSRKKLTSGVSSPRSLGRRLSDSGVLVFTERDDVSCMTTNSANTTLTAKKRSVMKRMKKKASGVYHSARSLSSSTGSVSSSSRKLGSARSLVKRS